MVKREVEESHSCLHTCIDSTLFHIPACSGTHPFIISLSSTKIAVLPPERVVVDYALRFRVCFDNQDCRVPLGVQSGTCLGCGGREGWRYDRCQHFFRQSLEESRHPRERGKE
jgi:hypothetical protein